MLDNTNRQIILFGIAYGMYFLHMHEVIHRDLKPENILLDVNMHPKIIDFGTGKFLDKDCQLITQSAQIGTLYYMPPEYLNEEPLFVKKSDVYSFGMIMYEIITGNKPYKELEGKEMNMYQFSEKVKNENLRPKFPDNMNKFFKKLIRKCWSNDISERPDFEDIIKILAYNDDDSITDFYDEEDDDEDNDEITNKYYLDGIDIKKYENYIEKEIGMKKVKTDDDVEKSKYNDLSKKIENMEQEINNLKHKNRHLRNENKRIKNINDQILNDLNKIKIENEELREGYDKLENNYKIVKSNYHQIKEGYLLMTDYIKKRQLKIKDIKNDIKYIMDWENEMKQEHDKTINEIKTELNSLKITMKQEQDKKIQEIKTELNSLKNSQKIESNRNMSIKPSIKKRGKSAQHLRKKSNIIVDKTETKRSQSRILSKPTTVDIPYESSSKLNGIIDYLNCKSNGIVSYNGVVQVSCSSTQPNLLFSVHDCRCLCDFKDLSKKSMWSPNNEKNSFVQFDFCKNSVNVLFYSLQTPTEKTLDYPKSWEVKCSNNLKEWIVIDKQINQKCMNACNVCNTFKCQNCCSQFFRYIRIVNIDECWSKSSRYYFDISAVEFYGAILVDRIDLV